MAVTTANRPPPGVRAALTTIRPALCASGTAADLPRYTDHVFDQKLDGVRALAAYDADGLRLVSRTGRDSTVSFPDLAAAAVGLLPDGVILDGEIVAATGRFQDIARRDRLTRPVAVYDAARTYPAVYVAFDVLHSDAHGGDLRHLPYVARRAILESLNLHTAQWATSVVSDDHGFYEDVRVRGGEGVIAKRRSDPYPTGRTSSWTKFKTVQTVTCVAYGYEPGEGSRSHFGAILLALIGPDGVTVVGKAGSGFTVDAALTVKAAIDHAATTQDVTDLPVVEIECLGRSRDNILRQPVFKGVRSDQVIADAVLTQLDTLPQT